MLFVLYLFSNDNLTWRVDLIFHENGCESTYYWIDIVRYAYHARDGNWFSDKINATGIYNVERSTY